MTGLSKLELQRQENIQRNKDLLRKLNLNSLSDSIKREADAISNVHEKKRKTSRPTKSVKKEPQEPTRRSRRLAGVNVEDSEAFRKARQEEEEQEEKRKELEKLRQTRLIGDIRLIDLITNSSSGQLKFERDAIGKSEDEINVKKENSNEDGVNEPNDQELFESDEDMKKYNQVAQIMRDYGDKYSAGDFCDLIRTSPGQKDDKELENIREEFDDKKLYHKYDPLDIKITHQRITSIYFHPSNTNRIIMAGDKVGNMGLWTVDAEQEDPSITILKPHGKTISKIVSSDNPGKVFSSSYDGSIREFDFSKQISREVAYLRDVSEAEDYPIGISDMNFCNGDPNMLYLTTLTGKFYKHDIREPFKINEKSLLTLHDKKIGGFSINPNASHQIASASLDRTLRIWDLRNISTDNSFWSEFDSQLSPHCYGTYNSRLSVSCVDWNSNGRLVCNGYDDNIVLFDLNMQGKEQIPVEEWSNSYMPRVKKVSDDILPDNISPASKIRHNCQTGRWVSILKARWQQNPQDAVQKFIIANMNRGFDIYDQEGRIISHLTDDLMGAVPAVCTLHPSENWCVGGSASGKLYFFE